MFLIVLINLRFLYIVCKWKDFFWYRVVGEMMFFSECSIDILKSYKSLQNASTVYSIIFMHYIIKFFESFPCVRSKFVSLPLYP